MKFDFNTEFRSTLGRSIIPLAVAGFVAFSACSPKGDPDSVSGISIHGVAARGAYLPQGSEIQLRAAAIDGVPSQILSALVLDNQGSYSIDATSVPGPYLVRVWDADSDVWYYSYSDGSETTVNLNPYTDLAVRAWYLNAMEVSGNPGNVNIDSIFESGVYPSGTCKIVSLGADDFGCSGVLPDNTPISLPSPNALLKIVSILGKNISTIYNIDIENVLTAEWVPGQGFDELLDGSGLDLLLLRFRVLTTTSDAARFPNRLEWHHLYSEVVRSQNTLGVSGAKTVDFYADIYTTQDSVELKDLDGGVNECDFSLILESTDAGIKHYIIDPTEDNTIAAPFLGCDIKFNGDNLSRSHIFAINYGVGPDSTWTWSAESGIDPMVLPNGSPMVAGVGATVTDVDNTSGTSITYEIPDLTPVQTKVTDIWDVVTLQDWNPANWDGSEGIVNIPSTQTRFVLHIVGKNGERTKVIYNP